MERNTFPEAATSLEFHCRAVRGMSLCHLTLGDSSHSFTSSGSSVTSRSRSGQQRHTPGVQSPGQSWPQSSQ